MSSGLWSRSIIPAEGRVGVWTAGHPSLLTAPGAGLRVRDLPSGRARLRWIRLGLAKELPR